MALPAGSTVVGSRALVDLTVKGTEMVVLRQLQPGEVVSEYIAERRALLADDHRALPQ